MKNSKTIFRIALLAYSLLIIGGCDSIKKIGISSNDKVFIEDCKKDWTFKDLT